MDACRDAPTHAGRVGKQWCWEWAKITELYPENSQAEKGEGRSRERSNTKVGMKKREGRRKEGGKKKRRGEEMTGM